jgi:hypothetical protein
MARKPIPDSTQVKILMKSRRRCCLCWGFKGEDVVKKGQIAHLDGKNSNCKEDNLVFLCLEHHDEYDSTPRQSKGLREQEVRKWRDELYKRTSGVLAGSAADDVFKRFSCHANSIIAALSHVDNRSPFVGIEEHLKGIAKAGEELGIPTPIEVATDSYPEGVEAANPCLQDRWEGRLVIRFPGGSEESGSAAHAYGVEMLVEARDSAIVALKQWLIHLEHGLVGVRKES